MGYMGMCGLEGYGFSAVLVINTYDHFGHKVVYGFRTLALIWVFF